MTLTELRYIVAVARERHFGRAAATCFVSHLFTTLLRAFDSHGYNPMARNYRFSGPLSCPRGAAVFRRFLRLPPNATLPASRTADA